MKNKAKFSKEYLLLGLISLVSWAGFLVFSSQIAGVGFPLDDAWIHQTFARNFAENWTWSFQLGVPSGGSTGPLWGFLLSVIHLAGLPAVWGTHVLGYLMLWACSIMGFHISKTLFAGSKVPALLTGSLVAMEWHLVWSALSGMETILLILLTLSVFCWILETKENWWLPGILTGIAIWVRPDGITLAGPVLLSLVFRKAPVKKSLQSLFIYLGVVILVASSYFAFNYFVAGEFWPNTFYAKQAEYIILRQTSIYQRYGKLAWQILTGVGIVLVPGLMLEMIDIYKKRDWERVGILLWAAGYVGIYAWRLPVVYQHGRYIMPAIPAFLILGLAGLARWLDIKSKRSWKRVLSTAWSATAGAVLLVFWGLGARAYALDVGVIETEMVRVARWVEQNTPSDAVIGAHDIGGLGYYGNRKILDLAGLVSPDVIPFIRDESRLAVYLNESQADYLVTFPSWYPDLVQGLLPVFQSGGEYSILFGMDQMTVYEWKQAGE